MKAVMKRIVVVCLALLASVGLPFGATASPAQSLGTPVFAIVLTRHGVRSFTHAPPAYTWPDWSPVAPGFLTAHGYRLMTELGAFYRSYLSSIGLPMSCAPGGAFVYADLDERTLETGRALIEGACGSPTALPLNHAADTGPAAADPLFDGLDDPKIAGAVDTAASRAAVVAAAGTPLAGIVARHAADFAQFQSLLTGRCAGTCAAVSAGDTAINTKHGLAELVGPIDTASTYAESLFLETAQCGPPVDPAALAAAMRLHVLQYDINSRNAYAPFVRGGNMLAHIVGLLERQAGVVDSDVAVPDISGAHVAFISGHDTQLGALGGILGAHWALGHGLVTDDMPPGGALIFTLYRSPTGVYRVHLAFAYETLEQLRSATVLPAGVALTAVTLDECGGAACDLPLTRLAEISHDIVTRGLALRNWTEMSAAALDRAPLADPNWTHCSAVTTNGGR